MKKPYPTFEIDSFEKLINIINEDNFEHLTHDLIMWLGYQVQFMAELRSQLPKKSTKDKTNWDLCNTTFIYIADGKHDPIAGVIVKNKLTGEIKNIKFKPKP